MKISTAQIDNFIANPPNYINSILFYGPDDGLVKERSKLVVSKLLANEFQLTKFDYEAIKNQAHLLAEALVSIPFGGGRRIVRLVGAPATIPTTFQDIILESQSAFLVIEAGDLPPTSSLRTMFEKANNLAAVACYLDEAVSIRRIIINSLKNANVSYSEDSIAYLESVIGGDRLLIRSEIDKLITYLGDKKYLTLEEVSLICGDPLLFPAQDLCNAVFNGKSNLIADLFERLVKAGVPSINIIRLHIRYLLQLYNLRSLIISGNDISSSVKLVKPPIFFKQVPIISEHIKYWHLDNINVALRGLAQLESECKKTGTPQLLILERALVHISTMVRS